MYMYNLHKHVHDCDCVFCHCNMHSCTTSFTLFVAWLPAGGNKPSLDGTDSKTAAAKFKGQTLYKLK